MSDFFAPLMSAGQAGLPAPWGMRLFLHGAWALVLAAGVLWLTSRWAPRLRWSFGVLVAGVSVLPGTLSPAYWLGLAFQAPSLTSALLALCYLLREAGVRARRAGLHEDGWPAWLVLGGASVVLGWALLLDTLVWWPVSVYAWGFSPAAVALVALGLALVWMQWGQPGAMKTPLGVLGAALALFVLTRWPSGNVWDALLDPWLWAGLQLAGLISGVRYWRRRGSAAIRV